MLLTVPKFAERRQFENRNSWRIADTLLVKANFEGEEEISSSSENSAKRAVSRYGLARAGGLAVGIDRGFPVSERQVSADLLQNCKFRSMNT